MRSGFFDNNRAYVKCEELRWVGTPNEAPLPLPVS
jgi:hypothetical protein